jgi:site-specific recombinase XerD
MNPQTLQETLLVPSFIRSLRAENAASHTIETYQAALDQLATFLRSKGMPIKPASIKREHIESFIEDIIKKGRKPSTASNHYRALQRYFRWLVEDGEIKDIKYKVYLLRSIYCDFPIRFL